MLVPFLKPGPECVLCVLTNLSISLGDVADDIVDTPKGIGIAFASQVLEVGKLSDGRGVCVLSVGGGNCVADVVSSFTLGGSDPPVDVSLVGVPLAPTDLN